MPTDLPMFRRARLKPKTMQAPLQARLRRAAILCLLAATVTHIADGYGLGNVVGLVGRAIEEGVRLITSVPVPFG